MRVPVKGFANIAAGYSQHRFADVGPEMHILDHHQDDARATGCVDHLIRGVERRGDRLFHQNVLSCLGYDAGGFRVYVMRQDQ
jgi:hypothetical protein